ncbi:MAG: HDIG domain-containing protein [Ignavibacteriaceae bacterium]|nr:HDIG domain-containing protein [Ignavibacteriaceae bacterium]
MSKSFFSAERLKTGIRVKILLIVVTALLITFMFPEGRSLEAEATVGSVWLQDDLIAPFNIPILKSEEAYKTDIKRAESRVYLVFVPQDIIPAKMEDSIKRYNEYLVNEIDGRIKNKPKDDEQPTFLTSNSYARIKAEREKELKKRSSSVSLFLKEAERLTRIIYDKGILGGIAQSSLSDSIAVRRGNIDQVVGRSRFIHKEEIKPELFKLISQTKIIDDLKAPLLEYVDHFIVPNLTYDQGFTEEEKTVQRASVGRFLGIINENEKIVGKHEKITPEIKLRLDSYKLAKASNLDEGSYYLQLLGKFLHITALISLLGVFIFFFRKRILADNTKLLLIAIMILWISFVTYLVNFIQVTDSMQFLVFVPAASMLLTIMFDSRIGFYSTTIIALIAAALRGNDYIFAVMNIAAGALSAYSVRDIKERTQIFRSFTFILIGYTITIIAFALERFEPFSKMVYDLAFAASGALISPVLTYGLLIFFERLFKITTDLTLLELTNFDRPALKELALKAPGSFNHSLVMGTIAEAAAEKIGANALLARVGAYYHDIGKVISPVHFVENQIDVANPHDSLLPEESVKVIINHVKRGKELAESYNLPQEIIDFIPMHHGTSVITYFYEKAKSTSGGKPVDINKFRYPGPKPNSKETAIVMLADSCESAVKSMEEPDQDKVENMISNLIQARIDDGQLDESNLTFKDLVAIKEVFANILISQHYRRIKYPNQEELERGD